MVLAERLAEISMPGGWTMSTAWMRMPGWSWPSAAASFLATWVVTMVAMMLPALVPKLAHYREAVARSGESSPGRLTALVAPGYCGTMVPQMREITRVQTGVRVEARLLKVLKALATELDLTLGDLLEGIVLHAFEGKAPFSTATMKKIRTLKDVYGLELTAADSHRLREARSDA